MHAAWLRAGAQRVRTDLVHTLLMTRKTVPPARQDFTCSKHQAIPWTCPDVRLCEMPLRSRLPALVLLAYVAALAAIAFWPTPVDRGAAPLVRTITRLIPVLTYDRIEFAANIALFVPFGVLVGLLLRQTWLVLPLAFLTTLMIETAQALLLDRRTPSIMDIIANTAGACIGVLVVVFIRWLQHEHQNAVPATAMPLRPPAPASRR
ncbi:hypothetical protein GCM10009532_13650 [Microbacterium aurantiacum]